jgi:hypothetical protein
LPGSSYSDDEDVLSDGDDKGFITVQDALKVLRDTRIDTQALEMVENAVWKRITGYPQAILQHTHLTKAYIPSDIALALTQEPSLVQRAVETFYTRDSLQLRAAHQMTRFPPSTSLLSSVRMTRTAYAQLAGQKFYPPKIFGRWKEKEGTKEWRWRDIGMKIVNRST